MRRIRYISPVESMSGNLSGNQKLQYANNNNPAYDAPDGQQAARNYIPRFIASERKRTGQQLFSVKTKSTTKLDVASRRRMASLAITQIFSNSQYGGWPLLELSRVSQIIQAIRQTDKTMTFRKYVFKPIYNMLVNELTKCTFYGTPYGLSNAVINNPFYSTAADPKFDITDLNPDLKVKFWSVLALGGININIVGMIGISYLNFTFDDLISSDINTLGLTLESVTGQSKQAVKLSDQFVCYRSGTTVYACASDTSTLPPIDLEDGMYILAPTFPGFEP